MFWPLNLTRYRYSTWEPEENILDPRLIQQFIIKEHSKLEEGTSKRGRKPKVEPPTESRKRSKSANKTDAKDGGGGGGGESSSSEEEKQEESPKPAFLRETLSGNIQLNEANLEPWSSTYLINNTLLLSPCTNFFLGRNPKPPQRYEEKEKKRKRHKSTGNKSAKDSDSSDSESAPSRTNTPGKYSSL